MFPTRNFERLVINALPIFLAYFHYPNHLTIGLEVPKASGKLAKKFATAIRNLPRFAEFVLKL